MRVSVFFSKIRYEIISNLKKANREIKLAVAWLTDEDILRELTHRRKAGVVVKVVISDSTDNFVNTNQLRDFLAARGELFVSTKTFLHHKFCIIDEEIIINGSYNWSYSARTNEENIMVLMREANSREENLVFDNFKAKHNFLCEKYSLKISDLHILNTFKDAAKNTALILSVLDQNEIKLRQQFQERIKESFAKVQALKISVSPSLLERMQIDGGGVEFVKRILHDEMASGDMKSGFKKLEEHIPHKVELSLEYLVIQPQFISLFTSEEVEFCKKLMAKYNLS